MATLAEQIKDIRNRRNTAVTQARVITDKAYEEKRQLTAEESAHYDRIMTDVDAIGADLRRAQNLFDIETADARAAAMPVAEPQATTLPDSRVAYTQPAGTQAARDARRPWETEGEFRTRQRRNSPEYRAVFNHFLLDGMPALETVGAKRAIQADSDIVGGYLVAPQEFVAELIKFVDNLLWIRQYATKYTVKSAQSLGAPSLDVDIADADWTSELDTGNEDAAMAFGKRELVPRPLAKRIKVSNRLLRMASLSAGFAADGSAIGGGPEGIVKQRLGYKFAVTEEKAFYTGTGANQPLGMYIASSRGVSTARDVNTGSSTGFTADGLIAAKYNMKVQYWPFLKWNFHRTSLQVIRQLKDGNGQYLWVPSGMGSVGGFSSGADSKTIGDMLLDFPVFASEYTPNTLTSGLYVGMLFDPRFYWICDSETMQIQRLVELYASANQTGFIARQEIDGMPVLEDAYSRLKCN